MTDDPFPVPKDGDDGVAPAAKVKRPRRKPTATKGKAGPKPGSAAASAAGRKGRASQLAGEVADEITKAAGSTGALLIPWAPLPGGYMVKTADELGAIVGRLARDNPRLLAMLRDSSTIMDYVALGTWSAGLLVAVGVQFGRVPIDGMVAGTFKIDEIADELIARGEARSADDGDEPIEPVVVDGAGDVGDGSDVSRPDFLGGDPEPAPEGMAAG